MYNEDRKNAFLATLNDNNKSVALKLFKSSKTYEEAANKDISEFTAYEFAQFLKLEVRLFVDRKSLCEAYIAYAAWSVKSEFSNHFEFPQPSRKSKRVPTKNISNVDNMVSCPRHLQKILDTVYPPINMSNYNENTVFIARRALYWLLFCGVPEDDVCKITKEHIYFDRRRIVFNGTEYQMYEESISALTAACSATQFKYEHPYYTTLIDRTSTSDSILRGIREFTDKHLSTQRGETLKDFKKKNVPFLIFDYVWKSGVFYRMYEEEISGEDLGMLLKEHGRLFGIPMSAPAKARKDLSQRYEDWKAKYKRV